MKKKLLKLAKMLSFLKEGDGLALEQDTFLCTGGLDGSDKIYGFKRENGELFVITRQVSSGYHIGNMDKDDLDYMFNGSSISKKIEKKQYPIVQAEEI